MEKKKLWQQLRADMVVPDEPRPEGAFTAEEFAAEFKFCLSHARRKIYELVAAGKVQRLKHRSGGVHTIYVLTASSDGRAPHSEQDERSESATSK